MDRDQHEDRVRGAPVARLLRRPGLARIAQVARGAALAPQDRDERQAEQAAAGVQAPGATRQQRLGQTEPLGASTVQGVADEAGEDDHPSEPVEPFAIPLVRGDGRLALLALQQKAALAPAVLTHHPADDGQRRQRMEQQDSEGEEVHGRWSAEPHFSDAFIRGGRGRNPPKAGGTGLENHLLECLDVAAKAGDAPEKRRRVAMGTAAWDLLDKPWKGLLLVALDKEEPAAEGESGRRAGGRNRRMRGRGRRGRSGRSEDWLEDMDALLESDAGPGYRLAAMLVQRARLGEGWKPAWDGALEAVRTECAEGLHPVWARMGEEAPLIAELTMHPSLEPKKAKEADPSEWLAAARIDPLDRAALADWLAMPVPVPLSAEAQVSLQRYAAGLKAKGRAARPPKALDALEGVPSLLRALARLGCEDARGIADLEALEAAVGDLASNHLALARLRSGDVDAWARCRQAGGEDALSVAMRQQAWSDAPADADLSSDEIRAGLAELSANEDGRTLRWTLCTALTREGDVDGALAEMADLSLGDGSRLGLVISLLEKSGDAALAARVEAAVARFDPVGLIQLMEAAVLSIEVRAAAAAELQNRGGSDWSEQQEAGLDLFTELGHATRIGSVLMHLEDGAVAHPLRTLLVHHLLPGHADVELASWLSTARPTAMEVLGQASTGALSESSISLIKLLEGAPADLGSVNDALDRAGVQAFNQCRRAMMEDGDGLVADDLLDTLQSSVDGASLSTVERRLFEAVIDALRFNRALRLLESGEDEATAQAEASLEILVAQDPRKRVIDGARDVVLEHAVAIPELAEWHRVHAPSSGWHQLILAAIDAKRGNGLAAARAMRRASRDPGFVFEDRVRIARRALIAFAHAGQWGEAVEMLEAQPALQSALTGLFQLYLHVSDDARREQPEAARRRLLAWTDSVEIDWVENVEGEKVERSRVKHNSDELDLLFTYPNAHNLPLEPWQGRVRAAIRGIRENRRSMRSQLEMRFRNTLGDKAGVQAVTSIAEEAAGLDATQGLMMFERAMNSEQFSNNQILSLRRSQNAIFALNRDDIPIRARRRLRQLALRPLVLVDTNLLIDAAKERIGRLLDEESGLDTRAHGAFHRTILYRARSGEAELFIPAAAMNEFTHKMANLERVRALFNDVWLDEVAWVETITREAVDAICAEISADYNTWRPPADESFNETVSSHEEAILTFLRDHREIYVEVADMKRAMSARAKAKRTEIDGEAIYPEKGDRDIMRTAAALAEGSYRGIGSVLVATRDSDFCLVRRALEEHFGYGVVRSARELSSWL